MCSMGKLRQRGSTTLMLPGPLPGTTKCAFLQRPRPLLDLLSQAEPGSLLSWPYQLLPGDPQ